MLNSVQEHSPSNHKSPLAQWICQTLDQRGIRVHFQLRGNNLHILCEGKACPNQAIALKRLLLALQQTDPNSLIPADQPRIYQVLLYGRTLIQERPEWSSPVNLNQLDRHLEKLWGSRSELSLSATSASTASSRMAGSRLSSPASRTQGGSSLVLSNRSLARRGQPEAIARYLSETLSNLGVAVKVSVKTIPHPISAVAAPLTATSISAIALKRLWVTCEASYSPDPMLIGEPIAQMLRGLELDGFRDAIVVIQVRGEAKPDWLLRIDLTPQQEMLREWARWGDVGAIARLLNQALRDQGLVISSTVLQEATLHLSCSVLLEQKTGSGRTVPSREAVLTNIAPLLETLGPQGIHAATVYGQVVGQDAPDWVEWLDLPAKQHPDLAATALSLAQQGDWQAIAFLLNRRLNPDLDKQLATGGIRVQLLCKQDLLHVMSDAPVCPEQSQVGLGVAQFVKQLRIPKIAGVRVYGRRAGQKHPLWSYGADFVSRHRLVPEATPEFAATDAYVGDLISRPGDPIIRPDLTQEDIHSAWVGLRRGLVHRVQRVLRGSQLFTLTSEAEYPVSLPHQMEQQGLKVALIWSAVGLLLTFQTDRMLTQILPPPTSRSTVAEAESPPPESSPLSELPSNHSEERNPGVFNSSGFTQTDAANDSLNSSATADEAANPAILSEPVELPHTERPPGAQTAAAILKRDLSFSTFNSRQLNEKLAIYNQRLEQSGPPDVLIVGSSRALRGVDPIALQQALAPLGYTHVQMFNFGINGATAQVVDLLIQRILTPAQMPRLILWADGARAFNSGAVDVTYNGIAVSEGYRTLMRGTLPSPSQPDAPLTTAENSDSSQTGGISSSLTASYQEIDRWLSQRLADLSIAHGERDRLKFSLQTGLTALFPQPSSPQAPIMLEQLDPENAATAQSSSLLESQSLIDFDGFLPLSIRFNPATYYQQYARVSGEYDSDYENFQIEGKQAIALQSLLQFTKTRGVPVVFINLPLTQEYLDPTRLRYEQEFKQYMLSLAVNQQGLIFRDLSELWLTQDDYFSDPSHLNRYGAYEVSHRIAQDPMIPWSSGKNP